MDAATFLHTIIEPNAPVLATMDTAEARCLLHVTAGVESAWTYRVQKPVAYAHSYWQMERRGAAIEVLTNDITRGLFDEIRKAQGVGPGLDMVFDAIIDDDRLAYAMARLRYWIVPEPLPAIGDLDHTWHYYVTTWRPGKPDPTRFGEVYSQSVALFKPAAGAGGPGATA